MLSFSAKLSLSDHGTNYSTCTAVFSSDSWDTHVKYRETRAVAGARVVEQEVRRQVWSCLSNMCLGQDQPGSTGGSQGALLFLLVNLLPARFQEEICSLLPFQCFVCVVAQAGSHGQAGSMHTNQGFERYF
jgi:hypothetical protein